MADKVEIRVTKTTRVTIGIERLREIIREAVEAPGNATVDFDDTYFSEVTVVWTEDEPGK